VQYTVTYANDFDPQTLPNKTDVCTGAGGTCTVTVDRTLRGNPGGRSFAIGATAGYQYSVNSWDIVPSLSLNYRRVTFDSFGETDPDVANDGLALAFGDQTVESLRSMLGVEISRPVSMSFGILTPIVRVEWDHEYKTSVRTIDAHYLSDPSCTPGPCASNFALPTDAPSGNYGVAGAGLSVTLSRRVQAFVFDEALFGYSNYHSNSISLGVRAQF
jgi:outer membrane autotransporter protein